ADVLPARNLFEDEKTDFVAGVEEMPRLRIVGRAYDVAVEVVPKNMRVAPLRTGGHCLTNEGEGLMTIQPAQLDYLAIQFEAMIGELGITKADRASDLIDLPRSTPECHVHLVEVGMLEIPQLDRGKVRKVNRVHGRIGARGTRRNILRSLGDDAVALANHSFQSQRFSGCLQPLHEAIDVKARLAGENVFRLGKNIFNESGWHDAQ